MDRKEPEDMKKDEMKKIKDRGLIIGLIIGIFGGVMGNIWVASMYRMIDNFRMPDLLTFIVGLIAFAIITCVLLVESKGKSTL